MYALLIAVTVPLLSVWEKNLMPHCFSLATMRTLQCYLHQNYPYCDCYYELGPQKINLRIKVDHMQVHTGAVQFLFNSVYVALRLLTTT